jgi:serine phosphatase RsbU (regulator of sigma subunit)/anti-sigma regulatory factor (Ser/Thr protein kinase)
MRRRRVENDLKEVGPAVLWADDLASKAGIGEDTRYGMQVCLEEALTNLIVHGHAPGGPKAIAVSFRANGDDAWLSVSDDCAPFDVARAAAALPDRPPAGRIGGNGLRLLRNFASVLTYRSVGGRNTLEMAFRPSESRSPVPRSEGHSATLAEDAARIHSIPVLTPLTGEALTALLTASTELRFAPRDRIVRQTEPSDAAFIVLEGEVVIVDESRHGETLLRRASAPLLLGEIGALADIPRTATVRAGTSVRALRVEREVLLEACRAAPQILLSVVGRLGQQLQGVNRAVGLYAGGLAALEREDFDPAIIDELSNPTPELRDFAEAFRRLAGRIRQERRHRTEMASAALIQRAMLPQSLAGIDPHGRCEVFGEMKPARDVGGDFYDVFMLDEDRMALIVGDVCGKGVPASLFMSFAMTVFRAVTGQEREVVAMIARANATLHAQNAAAMFATVFLGVLDLATRRLDYACCGHNPPLLRRRSGERVTLHGGGTPLGLFLERRNTAHVAELRPGDALLLFTDGITESIDAAGAEYGSARVSEVLDHSYGGTPPAIVRAVMDDVLAFSAGAEPSDDITCLAAVIR